MTYGSQAFKIAFTDAMLNWYKGGKVDPDPRGQWECIDPPRGGWIAGHRGPPSFSLTTTYRWKPAKKRIVIIGGVELVAPETVAPETVAPVDGTTFIYEMGNGSVEDCPWTGSAFDKRSLANGKVFLTSEDCQAMSDAQRKQRLGGGV